MKKLTPIILSVLIIIIMPLFLVACNKTDEKLNETEIDYKKLYEEELAINVANFELTKESQQLKDSYNNLVTEKSQLQNEIITLTNEKNLLQSQIDTLHETAYTSAEYNGMQSSLQNQINSLNSQITSKENSITSLNSQITSLQGQITEKSNQITALQGQITTLQNSITPLNEQISNLTSTKNALQEELNSLQTLLETPENELVTKLAEMTRRAKLGAYLYLLGTTSNANSNGYIYNLKQAYNNAIQTSNDTTSISSISYTYEGVSYSAYYVYKYLFVNSPSSSSGYAFSKSRYQTYVNAFEQVGNTYYLYTEWQTEYNSYISALNTFKASVDAIANYVPGSKINTDTEILQARIDCVKVGDAITALENKIKAQYALFE